MRQLAAILFTDIQGYTSMMHEDEDNALKLRNKFQQKLEEAVSHHHGQIVEFNGDGAMVSFPSAIEGVKAAISVQLEMQNEPSVPLRMGMHSGDVMISGKKVYGDGVNIASRMESFAQPGSILISRRVYEDIKNHKNIQAISLGTFKLKNVKEPSEIYAISNKGIKVPDAETLKGKGEKASNKNILVLPFINMSTDKEKEYFSDGLTDELITRLARLGGVKVISRTTSMQYKGSQKDIHTISAETAAGYIVEGSIRTQGNKIRINAQFIDAERDVNLWAENFTGTIEDIFDMQEQVSAKIVKALQVQLTGGQKVLLRKRFTDNPEAYQLYLKGRHFWKKRNEESLKTAIRFFEKAIAIDPEYALAWAGIADSYSLMGDFTNISRRKLLPKVVAAVERALEIDDTLPEAHISLAVSYMLNAWDWKNAEKEFRTGLELGPNYATGHHWYAELLFYTGRTAEAFHEITLAIDLDPVSQGILKDKGLFYYYNRQYDEAVAVAKSTLELEPDFAPAYRLLSMAYTALGDFDKAIDYNTLWGKHTGNKIKTDVALAYIYAVAGRCDEAEQLLPGIPEHELSGNDFRGMALVYAALGEADKAFQWLDKSYHRHEESLISMNVDPKYDKIRNDPRFDIMLKRIGLSQ